MIIDSLYVCIYRYHIPKFWPLEGHQQPPKKWWILQEQYVMVVKVGTLMEYGGIPSGNLLLQQFANWKTTILSK